jgi:hypothetical protein
LPKVYPYPRFPCPIQVQTIHQRRLPDSQGDRYRNLQGDHYRNLQGDRYRNLQGDRYRNLQGDRKGRPYQSNSIPN